MRIVTGIQPSGRLHLGNYLGAVQGLVELQQRAETFCFIADLHALTSTHDGPLLAGRTRSLAADLLALGVDRDVLFRQSDIAEVTKLAWLLATVTPVALLQRAHAYKDKVGHGLVASAGLFTYPVLMAADILLYAADAVPVGEDQLQHLELTRDMAGKLNAALAGGAALLVLPEPIVRAGAGVVPGTDGRKMSKSYGNTIDVFADDATLERQVMGIVTDATPVAAPKPLGLGLLELLRVSCAPEEAAAHERSWREGGVGYGAYKRRLLTRLHELFDEARRRRAELVADEAGLERTLDEGAARARVAAAPVWQRVARAAGVRA